MNISMNFNSTTPQPTSELPLYTAFLFGLIGTTGVLGNLLVVVAVAVNRAKTLDDYLIIILSISDFINACCALFITANQYRVIDPDVILIQCRYYMTFNYASLGVCIDCLLIIALNRYFHVLYHHFQVSVIEGIRGYVTVALILVFQCLYNTLAITLNPLNNVVFTFRRGWCYIEGFFVRINELVFIFIPLLSMTLIYIRIFVYFRMQRNKVVALTTSDNQANNGESARLIKTMVSILIAYSMCFFPYLIMIYAPTIPEMHIIGVAMIASTSVIDPIIYTIMNSRIRRRIVKIFVRCQYSGNNL